MKTNKIIAIASILLTIMTLYVNYLATTLPLNGKDTRMLSDMYRSFITPAPGTFSIWGIIYIGLAAYLVWQAKVLISNKSDIQNAVIQRIGFFYCVTCVFNASWLVAWHYEKLLLSVSIMLSFLFTLTSINTQLFELKLPKEMTYKWIVKTTFGLYLGWISIATIVNITAYLISQQSGGLGLTEPIWAMIMIMIGAIVAVLSIQKHKNIGYGLAVIWALFGIAAARKSIVNPDENIVLLCYVLAAVVGIMVILNFKKFVKS